MRQVVFAALLVLLVGIVPMTVTGASINVTVSNVDVSPSLPAPGETITFTTTIQNFQSSSEPMEIQAVAIRRAQTNGIREYTRVEDLGTLSPGSEVEVPLTVSFENAGTRNLRVLVFAHPPGDPLSPIRIRYPVTVSVRERHPQLDITVNDSVAGVKSNGTIRIANGLDTELSNVEVTTNGTGIEMIDRRDVFASIGAGETQTGTFSFRPRTPGPHDVTARLTYTVEGDAERTTTQTTLFRSAELRDRVILDSTAVGSGASRALAVDVVNQGNAPIEDVVVTAASDNATFRRALVSRVEAGSSQRVRLNATLLESRADATVTARYEIATTEQTVSTTTSIRSTPGAITLTGLDVTRENGRLQISGSTANVGLTDADSVLVAVVPTENVEPAFPNKEYFVGTVPASDFVSFDVYARTSGGVTSIPLEVTYLVDDERKRQTFDVDVRNSSGADQGSEDTGSGFDALLPVVGVGILALLAIVVVLVRRYRGSDDEIDI